MAGCDMPVIINSGSGNQGIASSVPVIVYARENFLPTEQLYRALAFSGLLTVHQKEYIGKLSAFCGAVSASCAAGAARAMLKPAGRAQTVVTQTTRPNVYELMRLADRLMASIGDALEQIGREQSALPADAPRVTGELLQPIQMLMEAVYTGDGNYALKAAPQIVAALNDEGVRLVEYSPETREYFDLFPGTEPDLTIRPAVMQGERVLARGQATEEM